MANQRPDVLEVLENEKKWYQEQITRINVAISALKGEIIQPKQMRISTSGVQWSFEIDKVFDKYHDKNFNLQSVRKNLAEEGIQEALNDAFKNTINSCLARKVTQGKLERVRPGFYRKRSAVKGFGLEENNE